MAPLRTLLLDLKSYYPSPAYQLGLLVAYAQLDESVARNMRFTFTEHPRHQPAEEIAELVLESGADLVAASNYAWNYKKICQVTDMVLLPARGRIAGGKLPFDEVSGCS